MGQLFLGNTILDSESLSTYQEELNSWGNYIEADGDILLYGCNVAADLSGAEFVKDLSEYTQADIQASDDLTGNSLLDGDWDLEYATGDIEAETVFKDEVKEIYQNTLVGSSFDIDLVVDDINLDIPEPDIYIPSLDPYRSPSSLEELAFQHSSLIYLNDSTLRINPNGFGFNPNRNYVTNGGTNNPVSNGFTFGFTTETLNFDQDTFDFNNVTIEDNNISFGLNNFLDISNFTDESSISFNFLDHQKLVDGKYAWGEDRINIADILSFDVGSVTFESSSVTFTYDQSSVEFNPDLLLENAHLFDYKVFDSEFDGDFVSFTESEFAFKEFNASDYRALEYAFVGDELFDPEYYLDHEATPIGMNPFTDYVENGWKLGLNPHPLFDVDYYLKNNSDVLASGDEPFRHYSTVGYTEDHENRDPNGIFDTSYYNANNPDVVKSGMVTLYHYATIGDGENHENRDPNQFFDNSYYNLNNPDVAADPMTAAEHWANFGYIESRPENPNFNPNRNTHPFLDSADYYIYNEDVRIASYNLPSANPNQHLREFGLFEPNRITHEIFQSENVVKISKEITADSEEFPQLKSAYSEIGINLNPTNDGNIIISQSSPIGDDDPTVGGLIFTIFLGAVISTYQAGQAAREFFDNNINWELDIDPQSANDTNTPIYIELNPDLVGTKPFLEGSESPPIIEIFRPEQIDGLEDIEFIPLENIELPNILKTPTKDAILEDLLNGGIFLGGQEIPQGTYALASTNDGDLYYYDPTDLSNADNWDARVEKFGSTTILDRELPYRVPNSVREQQRSQGLNVPNEPTHGIFYGGNVSIKLTSGSNITSRSYRQDYMEENNNRIPAELNNSLRHVEGNAATIMRELNISDGVVFINHEKGPCPSCLTAVENILLEGQTLTVYWNDAITKRTERIMFNGKASR